MNKGTVKWFNYQKGYGLHIAKLIGRVCGAKRPHSVSEQPIYHLSV